MATTGQTVGQRGKYCIASTLYHPRVTEMTRGGASDEAIRKKQCPIGGGTFDLFRSAGRNRQHDKQTIGQRGKYCVASTHHPRVTEITSGGASDGAIRKKQCPIGGGAFDLFSSAGKNRQHDKQTIGQRGKHCVASTHHPRVTEMTSGGEPLTKPSGRSSVRLVAALLICSDLLAKIVSTTNRRLAKEGNTALRQPCNTQE